MKAESQSVCKAVDSTAISDEALASINRYTRRNLTREEVFVFSVILCDNEVDRDLERFPDASLEKLGELFLGSTGVFDHAPKAENQSARIFDTALEQSSETNSVGEAYCALKAWAYMLRCDKNADLILEIDGGIKKEVSVGCAVDKVLCSICGADRKNETCEHHKGELYDGVLCHHLLVEPTDAYEWSFVAVPAQKKAGVVKRLCRGDDESAVVSKAHLLRLEQLAAAGKRYEDDLKHEVVRLGLLSGSSLSAATLEGITERLDSVQLEALRKSYGEAAARSYPLRLQLAGTALPPNFDSAAQEFYKL